MITEKSNRLQVIVITDYDYPISGTGSRKQLSRRHVELIKHAKCHVGTFFISKIPHLSNKTDTDWPFRFIAQGLDVCLAI